MTLLGRIASAIISGVGMVMLSLQERLFIEGRTYTASDYNLNVGAGAVLDFIFDPTACPGSGVSQIVSEVPRINATAGPVTVESRSSARC